MIYNFKEKCTSIKSKIISLLFLYPLLNYTTVYAKDISNVDRELDIFIKCTNFFLMHGDTIFCVMLIFKLLNDIRTGLNDYKDVSYWIRTIVAYAIVFFFIIFTFSKIRSVANLN